MMRFLVLAVLLSLGTADTSKHMTDQTRGATDTSSVPNRFMEYITKLKQTQRQCPQTELECPTGRSTPVAIKSSGGVVGLKRALANSESTNKRLRTKIARLRQSLRQNNVASRKRKRKRKRTGKDKFRGSNSKNFVWSDKLLTNLSELTPRYKGGEVQVVAPIPWGRKRLGTGAQGVWLLTR